MRLLVLGGTWFVGRTVAEAAVARGWTVSTFTRRSELPSAQALHGDRADDATVEHLAAAGEWDAVVDTSGFVPRQVSVSACALEPAAGRYVYISSVSTYRQWPDAPVEEDSPVHDGDPAADGDGEPEDPVLYGQFKRGCELAVQETFGAGRSLVLRPTVILGPHEVVGRLPWWLARMTRGGQVQAPGDPLRQIQPIDARDLAAFVLDGIERGLGGTFNMAAPIGAATMRGFLEACAQVTATAQPGAAELHWVDGQWLRDAGVREWTELPLWRDRPGTWRVDATRAAAAGLRCRPLEQTVAETWSWMTDGGVLLEHVRQADHGLSPEREAALLASWRQAATAAAGGSGGAG